MESDEASDDDFSAIELPPIIDQLKRLLEQYSDGQIIKELIQNAEDGGATKVKFLYTDKKHKAVQYSKKAWKETPIKIAMQAPALCVYNDGIFTDKDWKGIAAIQCSEKEKEPLKVGRFGLGFKSVFHLTDFPLILSGDKIMVMNPLANVSKVVHSKKLSKVDIDSQRIMVELIGNKFGFAEQCFKDGYNGTLFWFPLRTEPSDLSRDTYSCEKIQDIFLGFKDLAPSILLFLKKIEFIEVFEESENDLIYRVQISAKEQDLQLIRQQRRQFLRKVEDLNGELADEYFDHHMNLSIICEGKKWLLEESNTKDWIVVNHYHGGNVSDDLQILIDDEEWSYSPYVSVAGCLSNSNEDFKGHIYCFLPLPLERTSPTGLPVHINGFFALSQDRHHIKWMSTEEENRTSHSENSVEWNRILATEVLPLVYTEMLTYLTKADFDKNTIYKLLPKPELITENWKVFIEPLFEQLYQENIIFTKASGGRWIQPHEAIVLVEEEYEETILKAIEDIYLLMERNVSCLPQNFVDSLKPHGKIEVSDPSLLNSYLIQHKRIFDLMNNEQKITLLEYFVSCDIEQLKGVKLLPLADGKFQIFNAGEETVYWCTEDSLKLFLGMESRCLLNNLSEDISQKLIGRFQVKQLQPEHVPELLENCLEKNSFKQTEITPQITTWLENVWKYIHKNAGTFELSWISDLYLLPFHEGDKSELIKVNSVSILSTKENMGTLDHQLLTSLKKFGVKIFTSLSNTISTSLEGKFIEYPTTDGIFNCMKKIMKSKKQIEKFNQETSSNERNQLLNKLATLSGEQVREISELIRQLKIFKVMNSNQYVCLNETYQMYYRDTHPQLPIPYQGTVIECTSNSIRELGNICGCDFFEYDELIEDILVSLPNKYEESDKLEFMKFFLNHLSDFEENDGIMELASNVCFVKNGNGNFVKPKDLLDPNSTLLKDMFQPHDFPSNNCDMQKLKKLGLRFEEDLTGKDILKLAETVIDDGTGSMDIFKRGMALCQWIDKYISKFDQGLIDLLASKTICPIMNRRPTTYPEMLPFMGEDAVFKFKKPHELFSCKDVKLVGGVGVLSNEDIPQCFKTYLKPVEGEVFEQLNLVTSGFSPEDKIKFLPVMNEIYEYIDNSDLGIPDEILNQEIIWTGSTFESSSDVYCTVKKDDLPLQPYRYPMPLEMQKYHSLYEKFGCKKEQNDQMLLDVLGDIKEKHDSTQILDELDVSKDTSIVLQIVNKLVNSPGDYSQCILLPIHTDSSKLLLKPATECTVCNESWLQDLSSMDDDYEDEDDIFYVHKEISSHTAARFKVPLLKDRVLGDADKFDMNFGQNEPLTTRLKNLLNDYTDGFTVPKEIIQNADDAGASVVKFLYDERRMPEALTCLFDEGMEPVQGPAFWAYNDAKFTDTDYENITKLAGATKKDDQMKIGRFGLGFNSVYNLTDTPSFISGDTYVIFDPHETHLQKSGLKIKLNYPKNRRMRQKMKGQFYPFDGVFQCKVLNEEQVDFDGTLFRFPLRNQSEADKSLIKDFSYSQKDMKEFIRKIVDGCGNLLLFTQNVKKIELYHLCKEGKPIDAELILKVTKSSNRCGTSGGTSALKILTNHNSKHLDGTPAQLSEENDIVVSIKRTATAQNYFELPNVDKTLRFLVSWSFGKDKVVNAAKRKEFKGLLPVGGTAVLRNNQNDNNSNFGFYDKSHLFCFLPLPIPTSLPAHVNGSFAVQSSRRDLVWKNEDDIDVPEDEWNRCLLEDACCQAYLLMMTTMVRDSPMEEYNRLWPNVIQCTSRHDDLLSKHIYKTICNGDYRVFQSNHGPVSINNAIFLDPSLRGENVIGEIALKALRHFSETNLDFLTTHFHSEVAVVDMSPNVWNQFKSAGCEQVIKQRMVTIEQFYSLFFPTLTDKFWSPEEIDELLLYSLLKKNTKINELIRNSDCIPTKPNHRRRKPSFLIHPNGEGAELFDKCEERFPDDTGLKTGSYRNSNILDILQNLGMVKDDLPWDQMPERITVALNTGDKELIQSRFGKFITYMSTRKEPFKVKFEFCPENIRQTLANLPFLPVQNLTWKFPQFTNKIFVAAHEAYLQELKKFVGCISPIIDSSIIGYYRNTDSVLKWLGVKHSETQLPLELVLENMLMMSQFYSQSPTNFLYSDLDTLFKAMYKYLNDKIDKSEETLQNNESIKELISKQLQGKAVVLHMGSLTTPDVLVLEQGIHIEPYISTTKLGTSYKKLFTLIGVLPKLTAMKILEILILINNEKGDKILDDVEIITIAKLCRSFVSLPEEERCMDNVREEMKHVKLPDSEKRLTLISSLCFDDSIVVYNQQISDIKHLHKSFDRNLAEVFGVKSKRGHSFDAISSLLFTEFGQHEDLTNRIKRILEGYPCDESILKEMLQNADDAGATEVIFIKDFRTLPKDTLPDSRLADVQGPALCVFNNSCFTKEDLKGIQDLGTGSKKDEVLKTGQYGVGFNVVYHVTDVPSFWSKGGDAGEIVCVFDPHCKYLSMANILKPGVQIDADGLRNSFPDFNEGFLPEFTKNWHQGTVFRLPLRNSQMAGISEISEEVMTEDHINEIFELLKKQIFSSMLFLENITSVKFGTVEADGMVTVLYEVESSMDKQYRHEQGVFNNHLLELNARIKKQNVDAFHLPQEVTINMKIKDSSKEKEDFLIVKRAGFINPLPEKLVDALKTGKLKKLPRGGVAMNLKNQVEGIAYCTLPLPITTGLPAHVNGQFALDHESRRNIWNDETSVAGLWNSELSSQIIVPAYLSLLEEFKVYPLSVRQTNLNRYSMGKEIEKFENLLPKSQLANGKFWKDLVLKIYTAIGSEKRQVFPVVKEKTQKWYDIEWVAVQTGEEFNGCFDTLYIYYQDKTSTETTTYRSAGLSTTGSHLHTTVNKPTESKNITLKKILMKLGMKVLETSEWIFNEFQLAEVKVQSVNPENVLQFLKSFQSQVENSCQLNIPDRIQNTPFECLPNFKLVLKFLLCGIREETVTILLGSPLLLRQNCMLDFYGEETIIVTRFCNIFREFSKRFIHIECVNMMTRYISNFDPLIKWSLESFVEMFKQSYGFLANCNVIPWNPEKLPMTWISKIWKFIHECLPKQEFLVPDSPSFKLLAELSIVPARKGPDGLFLYPLCKGNHVLHHCEELYNSKLIKLEEVLQKLYLPFLVYIDLGMSIEELKTFRCTVAKLNDPQSLVKLLKCHSKNLIDISVESAKCVLDYFNSRIEDFNAFETLKSLPLFETHDNTLVSINPQKKHICIKSSYPCVPKIGLEHWAETSNIIILKYDYSSELLYKQLNINCIKAAELYCDFLLPNFDCFKTEHYLVHLEYIRDNVLQNCPPDAREKILLHLKGIKFIQSSYGVLKKSGDFYDKKMDIFKIMMPNSKFPPAPFDEEVWYDFLVQTGLVQTVSVDLFVEFANSVQEQADNRVTKDVIKKSNILVEHLCDRPGLRQEGILPRIKHIRFVKPIRLNDFRTKIHPQFKSDHSELIQYSGAVLSSNINNVWTVANCISSSSVPYDRHPKGEPSISQLLDVLPEVDLRLFYKHMKNVCLRLNERLMNEIGVYELVGLFEGFYEFIRRNEQISSKSLENCPTIYLPETNQLIEPWRVLLEPEKSQLIDNRIFRASVTFGRYFDVMKILGVKENAEASIYLKVLKELYNEWKGKELSPNEYIVVKKCVVNLNTLWKDGSTRQSTIESIDTLYLPSETGIMQSSKTLVLEDNQDLRNRVAILDLEYFVGFEALKTDIRTPIYDHRKWPDIYRIKLLSEIVTEVLNPDCQESYGEISSDIEYRLKHPEMINALVRLIKHFHPEYDIEDELEDNIGLIHDIRVVEVDNLSLKLQYKNEMVERSESNVKVFGTASQDSVIIYVAKSFEKDDMMGLVDALDKILPVTHLLGEKRYLYLSKLLEMVIDASDEISIWLDKQKITHCNYRSKREKKILYPKPGTLIPGERHWLLDNSFVRFHVGEYVGYEVYDPDVNDEPEDIADTVKTPVYIYAVIVEILQTETETEFARYKINIGEEENIDVDSTKIYKFHNNLTSSSREVVLSEESQQRRIPSESAVPRDLKTIQKEIRQMLNKAWKLPEADRKRVIKRLLLKWHPDKNRDIVKLATEITQKIFNYVEHLENGKTLDEDDDDDKDCTDGMSSSSRNYYSGGSYGSFYSNMHSRGRSYAHYSDHQRSSRSYTSDSSFHFHTGPIPRPDQARRWFRQARFDLEAAEESHNQRSDNYNWICYMCQQAAEKALKAVWYTIDSNKVSQDHNLDRIVSGLFRYPELVSLANELQSRIGDHTRMRYPDTLHFPKVPKDVYDPNDSTEACKLTRQIVDYVSNNVLCKYIEYFCQ